MATENTDTKCPYCEGEFAKPPQRKSKCKACGKTVFVKASPADCKKRLVTEKQAAELEAQWQVQYQANRLVRDLAQFGFTKRHLEKEMRRLFSKKTEREAYFALMSRVGAKAKDPHKRKMAHFTMALERERLDEPFSADLQEARRYELLQYRADGLKRVQIDTAGKGSACDQCESQSGAVWTVGEALTRMPLPCRDCQTTLRGSKPGFCRCSYLPVL